MPADYGRMLPVAFRQLRVHDGRFLPVNRGRVAMVMAHPVKIAHPVGAYPQHLGILMGHPGGTRAGWGSQPGKDTLPGKPVQHPVQPAKVETTFLGLQGAPGKNGHRHHIAVSKLHQTDIFLQDLGIMLPLVRVVIGSVHKRRKFGTNRGKALAHTGIPLLQKLYYTRIIIFSEP
ncbi:hypothetical protein D3C75_523510 [compost metagenome]